MYIPSDSTLHKVHIYNIEHRFNMAWYPTFSCKSWEWRMCYKFSCGGSERLSVMLTYDSLI